MLTISRYAMIWLISSASFAYAGACDWRPSQLIGGGGAGAVATGGGAAAAAGVGMKAAGFYTLTHATTGLTMLGSTAGGVSAAGTVGIMGGTAGVIGTVGAIVMAPVTVIAGAATAVGVGAYEGVCYFQDERVTDYGKVDAMMANMAANADPAYFRHIPDNLVPEDGSIMIRRADGGWDEYEIRNLYIVNGVLKARDWGRNTVIGQVGYVTAQRPAD